MVYRNENSIYFDAGDLSDLDRLSQPVPESPMHVDDAVEYAFGLRDTAIGINDEAFQKYDGTQRNSIEQSAKAARISFGLEALRGRILKTCPEEELAFVVKQAEQTTR